MKKIYYFLVKSGEVLFIWSVLFILSISFYSFTIKGKVNYGDRCYQKLNDDALINYDYDGIILKSGSLECNTLYLEYDSKLNEKENLRFLVSLSKIAHDSNTDVDMHIIIKAEDYQILSSIVDYQVSYIKSVI